MSGTPVGQADLGGTHGDHVLEPVAAVYVEIECYWAESVGGIEITIALGVVCASPESFVSVFKEDGAEVMVVGCSGVFEFAKEPCAHHVEYEEFVIAVIAVFHHNAMPARSFRGINELPAVFYGIGRRDFCCGVFAIFHCREADGHVPFPGCGGVDEVYIVASHEFFKAAFAAGYAGDGVVVSGFAYHVEGHPGLFRHNVTERGYPDVLDGKPFMQHTASAESGAYNSNANGVVTFKGDADHGFGI